MLCMEGPKDWYNIQRKIQVPVCRYHPYGRLRKVEELINYNVSPFLSSTMEAYAAEFITHMVYWLWFDLREYVKERNQEMGILVSAEFLSWNRDVLMRMRISKNVMFYALLLIYWLKKRNPMIRGKPGSEYRLLTIALMLGNKFLDDNTYTNKTWAEMTGLGVKEIHVMEREFLMNIGYSLLVPEKEWKEWEGMLERLWSGLVGRIKVGVSMRNRVAMGGVVEYVPRAKEVCSRWVQQASTQLFSLMPPREGLKGSVVGCRSFMLDTLYMSLMMRVLPSCVRLSCGKS